MIERHQWYDKRGDKPVSSGDLSRDERRWVQNPEGETTPDELPPGQDVQAKHGETPNAADGIKHKGDLPAGGQIADWKTPVDTTTPGDKLGTVVVTYPDGTKDEVPVTVKVKPDQMSLPIF